MLPYLGIIEGYFGEPWSWAARHAILPFLAQNGYQFFIYAPKADAKLRREWELPFEAEDFAALKKFARACQKSGLYFGVGLSPFEIYRDFNQRAQAKLLAKLEALAELDLDILALLFDDMWGNLPDLAQKQIEIAHWVKASLPVKEFLICPSYYSDDPVLEQVFGACPPNYLRELGQGLDPAIQIFWTGEEVCSRAFSKGYLEKMGQLLGRKPFLWDNYPVNDGARMSQYLHLRGFTGRPAEIQAVIAGHAVNPALQPYLSQIPLGTLPLAYSQGADYCYHHAMQTLATEICGPALAEKISLDLISFQDLGRDRLGTKVESIRARYEGESHPAALEILKWLDGDYQVDLGLVQTQ